MRRSWADSFVRRGVISGAALFTVVPYIAATCVPEFEPQT
jgi:hypothetical protein